MEIVIATRNKKKLREIKDILKGMPLKFLCLDAYPDAPRVIENGKSFRENAAKKAVKLARFTGKLSLGEDSGLCVNALGGAPGIYSARFSGSDKDDLKNNLKLLKLLNGLLGTKRKAYYVCAVAIADKKGIVGLTQGRCAGRIALQSKGNKGFGYDPLFLVPAYNKTFGQLGEKIKHKMSHRYHALVKAKKIIYSYIVKHGRKS